MAGARPSRGWPAWRCASAPGAALAGVAGGAPSGRPPPRAAREPSRPARSPRLREEQAQMARDVHDVVGHSLAVILAQAESAQYIDDADTGRAEGDDGATSPRSARSSLQDVRQVLTATRARAPTRPGRLDEPRRGRPRERARGRLDGRRARPHPLPPELEHGRLPRPPGDADQRHPARWPQRAPVERRAALTVGTSCGSRSRNVVGAGAPRRPEPLGTAEPQTLGRGPGRRRHAATPGGGRRPARRTPWRRAERSRRSP